MRDFKITPEPSGSTRPPSSKASGKGKGQALSFVIQKHAARRLHYDFRLEIDGVMVSWAVPKGPSLNPADKRLAVMTEDHPMEYSSFEGIIPEKQYGAGEVIIWDRGIYSPDENAEYSWKDKKEANQRMRDGLRKGKLSFYLKGDKLEGSWTLVQLRGRDAGKNWLLIKHHDEFEDEQLDITEQDESVVSGQTIEGMQESGAKRIWTAKGAKKADPKTTGKSAKSGKTKPVTDSQEQKKSRKGQRTVQGTVQGTVQRTVQRAVQREVPREVKRKVQEKKSSTGRTGKNGHSGDLDSVTLSALVSDGRQAAFPRNLSPMLATLADAPFTRTGWYFEPKLDGVRAIAFISDSRVKLTSRRGLDLSDKYPSVCDALSGYSDKIIFDGEVVALDEKGKPSFQYLQQSSGGLRSFGKGKKSRSDAVLLYYVFDILYAGGRRLTELPLARRKEILEAVLKANDTVRPVLSIGEDGEKAFQACVDNGLEGIVGKRADSIYEEGRRSRHWLKVKAAASSEFVICGYTEGTGSRRKTFGSLLLGEYDDAGQLRYVGGVGTGFDTKRLDGLLKRLHPLIVKTCPFGKRPPGKLNPTWV
ncbi:MAG TPA: non-homologous end-joining DNA ligase, partial [Chroococcales cyanobacterium]